MAQETISPEMGLTAAPSQGFSEKAGTCSLHLAILQQTTYCTGRARPGPGPGQGPALPQGAWPRLQVSSQHTGVGTRTETFRFYWADFLVRNEGQFSHF